MTRAPWIVCLLLLQACITRPEALDPDAADGELSLPDAEGDGAVAPQGAPLSGLVATMNGSSLVVDNDHYRVVFSQSHGYAPIDLRIKQASGENILPAPGDAVGQGFAGTYIWTDGAEGARSWSTSDTAEGEETLEMRQSGPALVQFDTTWATGGPLRGSTRWTLWPDGRVHRHDAAETLEALEPAWLSAHVEVGAAWVSHVAWQTSGGADAVELPQFGEFGALDLMAGGPQDRGWICTRDELSGESVVWAHHDAATGAGLPHGLRISAIGELVTTPPVTAVNLQSDWWRGGFSPTALDGEPFDWGPLPVTATWVGDFLMTVRHEGSCDYGATAADQLRAPSPLVLTAGEVLSGEPGDRDGDGYNEGGGYYALQLSDEGVVSLRALDGVGPSVAFYLALPREDAERVDVTLEGERLAPDYHYLWQPNGQGGWLYLPLTLQPSATLTITQPAP